MSETNLRPELARHLRQRFQAFREGFRHNLALIGPPGSGKTFQLHQLLASPPQDVLLVYCPLYRESARSFLMRLLGAILHAGLKSPAEPSPLQADRPETVDALLQRANQELPRTAEAARHVQGLLGRRNYGETLNRTLDLIPILIEERHHPCVLIFDEFLYMDDLGFSHAFHELGKRVMTWPSTLFILASSAPYRARMILRERLQLLFGQFELLTLEAPEPATAVTWVEQELRGIRKAKTVSHFLIHWLGAYPWYLAVFLKRLKELAAIGRTSEVTEPLFLQTAWDICGRSEGPLHQWCASRLEQLGQTKAGARAGEALLQVAQGARTATAIGMRIGRGGLSAALQLLVEHDLAQRNGTCWIARDPILRCWLSTIVAAERSGTRVSGAELRQRFEAHVRALWTEWSQARHASLSDQVIALFGKFCDDTVLLDSKAGRLPKFTTITTQGAEPPTPERYVVAEGEGRRWCAAVREARLSETDIATFDAFCRTQSPRPSRKVVIAAQGLDDNARLLAKTVNMWVWGADDLHMLRELYGR